MKTDIFPYNYPSFSVADAIVLGQIVSKIASSAIRVLEVGSWLGTGSTVALIKALHGRRGLIYCVDTWKGNPNVEQHKKIVEEYDVFKTFLYNVKKCGGSDVVRPMIMSSRDAAHLVRNRSMDMVFIDADHSYNSVRDDIQLWLPKVKPGGILCGHDCEAHPEEIGRDIIIANKYNDAISIDGNFKHIHPGSILAVHEAFGNNVTLASKELIYLPDGSQSRSTIWWVKVRRYSLYRSIVRVLRS